MDAKEYQKKAHGFASYGNNMMYPVLGLAEEAGETCGKVAKFIRKHGGILPDTAADDGTAYSYLMGGENAEFRAALMSELSDVMWMVAEICTTFGFDMGDVMRKNLEKLADRKRRGVIVGEGDNR